MCGTFPLSKETAISFIIQYESFLYECNEHYRVSAAIQWPMTLQEISKITFFCNDDMKMANNHGGRKGDDFCELILVNLQFKEKYENLFERRRVLKRLKFYPFLAVIGLDF